MVYHFILSENEPQREEISEMMFPPVALTLFCLILFLLCFPLSKLPLSVLALEKGLNFGEQDTGQGVHFMDRYPGAVVVDLLFPCHRSRPQP